MSTVIDGSAGVTTNTGAVYNGIQSATAQASTSGTSIDFTSIPSWVKRITVMFSGISVSGTSIIQTQLGTSGGIQTTSYNGGYVGGTNASSVSGGSLTSGIGTGMFQTAAAVHYGQIIISLLDSATGTWAYSGVSIYPSGNNAYMISGTKVLSGTLDRIRITTVNGTDTFDAGTINILYE